MGFLQAILHYEERDDLLLVDGMEADAEWVEAEAGSDDWDVASLDHLDWCGLDGVARQIDTKVGRLYSSVRYLEPVRGCAVDLYDLYHCWKIHCA